MDAANECLISEATEMGDFLFFFQKKKQQQSNAYATAAPVVVVVAPWEKETEREIKEKEVGAEYPFDLLFFFLQIDQHLRTPFECKIRRMASACGNIFVFDL